MSSEPYWLFDTGPLLCFGALPGGPKLLAARYHARAGIISDVDRELQGLQRNNHRPVAQAAEIASRQMSWLDRHTIEDVAGLEDVQQLLVRLQTFKRSRDRLPPNAAGRKDWGECATIVLAKRLKDARRDPVVVAVNENPATAMAAADSIPTICAVDILSALVNDGALTAKKAFEHYRLWTSSGIDPGPVIIRSPADF